MPYLVGVELQPNPILDFARGVKANTEPETIVLSTGKGELVAEGADSAFFPMVEDKVKAK